MMGLTTSSKDGMPNYTQEHRLIHISSAGLDENTLLATRFIGTEFISDLFSFEITLLSSNLDLKPEEIVGRDLTVTVQDTQQRRFHGYINCFVFGEIVGNNLRQYQLTMVPWLWFLSQTNNHRIFQGKNTKDIITQVFKDLRFGDFIFRAAGGQVREYCIQHNESDLNFISRLLIEDGISYYFKHEQNQHKLILVDQQNSYEACAESDLEYSHGSNPNAQISSWKRQHQYKKGTWTLNDYDFKTPKRSLNASIATLSKFHHNTNYEHYQYPGLYGSDLGKTLVKMRIEAEEAERDTVQGASNYSSLYAGGHFTLAKHTTASEKGSYVLTRVEHTIVDDSYTNSGSTETDYSNDFTCVPSSIHIRPSLKYERPVMRGPQTAVVVGPAGDEIYVDEFGRIKVQFIWDREGENNEKSTCFLRVAQVWAGNKWGASFIPRIGQEVIVDFFDGDPDRPYVSGSVYNGKNLPPYSSKTQSGIKSRSTKGGSAENFNEIRFDDKKDAEQIYIHAEKNQDNIVENDETTDVGHDRTETIANDETISIGNDRKEDVGANETISIGNDRSKTVENDQTENIGNNSSHDIGKNIQINIGENHTETIGKNMKISVEEDLIENVQGQFKQTITKEFIHRAKKIQMVADNELSIKVGSATLVMKKNGDISINGKKIGVKASSDIVLKGKKIKEN